MMKGRVGATGVPQGLDLDSYRLYFVLLLQKNLLPLLIATNRRRCPSKTFAILAPHFFNVFFPEKQLIPAWLCANTKNPPICAHTSKNPYAHTFLTTQLRHGRSKSISMRGLSLQARHYKLRLSYSQIGIFLPPPLKNRLPSVIYEKPGTSNPGNIKLQQYST